MASDIGEKVDLWLNRSITEEELTPAMQEFAQKTENEGNMKFDMTDFVVAIGRDMKVLWDEVHRPWWKKLLGLPARRNLS